MLSQYLREPASAAAFAAAVTMAALYAQNRANGGAPLENHQYGRPAAFVAALVYFVVSNGACGDETMLNEPF